jgi:hypothetical protein
MTLHELLLKEGLTLFNHDRKRIGFLIGAKAKELSITKTQKAESNGDKHYKANDYDEAFAGDMLAIVKEFIANPWVVVERAKLPEPPKKTKSGKVLPEPPKKDKPKEMPEPQKKTRQQEWLEKRAKK